MNPLKICIATAEFSPLAKTGGLADVTASLAAYLHHAGHDVKVLLPHYTSIVSDGLRISPVDSLQDIPISIGTWHGHYSIDAARLPGLDLPVYLLRCPAFYDRAGLYTNDDDEHKRFILLSRATIEMCQHLGFAPDVFSCHDWHTALVPFYLKTTYAWDRLFASSRSVLTIHNLGYQGVFNSDILSSLDLNGAEWQLHQDDLEQGCINFLKTGLLYADLLTTVSPTYAREIQGDEYGMGLQGLLQERRHSLVGILNGIDDNWDPATDTLIPANFTASDLAGKQQCKLSLMTELGLAGSSDVPLIGIVSRLVDQKGIDLISAIMPRLLQSRHFSLAVLGSGEPHFEHFFRKLQQVFSNRVHFHQGYDDRLAHRIEAGSDMFLMPSLYEPCGLNQMYSLKYGTVPIVRLTGGLADSVEPVDPGTGTGTGIVFRDYDEQGLGWAINTALDLFENRVVWRQVQKNGMAMDFSWEHQGDKYVELFRMLGRPA